MREVEVTAEGRCREQPSTSCQKSPPNVRVAVIVGQSRPCHAGRSIGFQACCEPTARRGQAGGSEVQRITRLGDIWQPGHLRYYAVAARGTVGVDVGRNGVDDLTSLFDAWPHQLPEELGDYRV